MTDTLTCKWQLAGDVDALHDHSPPDFHHRSDDDDDDYGHDDESQFTIIIIYKHHHSLRIMCKSFTIIIVMEQKDNKWEKCCLVYD